MTRQDTRVDSFKARTVLDTPLGSRTVYKLDALSSTADLRRLPYSIKVLLESCLRNLDGYVVTEEAVRALAGYDPQKAGDQEIPFMPARVILQDFTGVPAMVDLAAMRDAIVRLTGNDQSATQVNPLVPCDLVIDHSVQVDAFGTELALKINGEKEFERNHERYQFLKWGQQAFDNFSVVPPATGIVHQVNLEYLAKVIWDRDGVLFPDSLVGTDSHTTMINGLGVVGWGVGGIEAEAVMLGQPIYMLIPEVVGMKLTGKLREGATATDLVLRVTEVLRKHGVVNKFVEFHGPGLGDMPVANRATIANMAPEYGATIGFFPIDEQTLTYLRQTGRDEKLVRTVEQYAKIQGLWRDDTLPIKYCSDLELDLSTVEPSLAGPRRPQDRVSLTQVKSAWRKELATGFGKSEANGGVPVEFEGKKFNLNHGDVVIAAITSCTNTSNPDVMIGAGLVARKAVERGLTRRPWVKTSLAPGSKVVTAYLEEAGLLKDLAACGFNLVGYGCTTCIGNSGPLPDPISKAINANSLVAAAVLSGNRNFEGRISPDVRANYLASPPLVVAYALAGTIDIDLDKDPIGKDKSGRDVFLRDIWPTQQEVAATVNRCVTRDQFLSEYANVFEGSQEWQAVSTSTGARYAWDAKSTYIQDPPFFANLPKEPSAIATIRGARCLVKVGDSVTTDHISPAGSIKTDSPAGKYLVEHGVSPVLFNSYGARRGNDRVMTRGTFANVRVRNHLADGKEGGYTRNFLTGEITSIYDASMHYQREGVGLIVLAGKDYGMGSSRDWAAKGTLLLGVKAVIAESFERIHRSNLVGMGVLPLCYKDGETAQTLGLTGDETFDIAVSDSIRPKQEVAVTATRRDGKRVDFRAVCRIDTPVEVEYYRNGGILPTVLRKMAKGRVQ
jgi:aconitate hydratase